MLQLRRLFELKEMPDSGQTGEYCCSAGRQTIEVCCSAGKKVHLAKNLKIPFSYQQIAMHNKFDSCSLTVSKSSSRDDKVKIYPDDSQLNETGIRNFK